MSQSYNDADWTGAAQMDGYNAGGDFDISFTAYGDLGLFVDSFVSDDHANFARLDEAAVSP